MEQEPPADSGDWFIGHDLSLVGLRPHVLQQFVRVHKRPSLLDQDTKDNIEHYGEQRARLESTLRRPDISQDTRDATRRDLVNQINNSERLLDSIWPSTDVQIASFNGQRARVFTFPVRYAKNNATRAPSEEADILGTAVS